MAKSKSGSSRGRGQKTVPGKAAQTAEPQPPKPKKRVNPFEFIRQVRAEGARTTWPTRKETGITTVMVFIMVALASVFFLLVDIVLQAGVGFILDLGI